MTDKTVAILEDLPAAPSGKTGWPWTEQSDSFPPTQPDGAPWPRVSVVTPSYNQEPFIEETIRSVLLQRYPNLEYIVVDGKSDDGTVEILRRYDSWIDHWVSESDRGQSHAINKGLNRTSGEVITWLNSDDFYAPGALAAMAQAFEAYGEGVGAIVGTGHKVNKEGEIVYTPTPSELSYEAFLNWMSGGNFMQPACFFRQEAWQECGPLREDLRYPLDVDLWIKMVKKYKFKRIGETIAFAYQHGEAKTTKEQPFMRAETIQLIAEHGETKVAWRELQKMAEDLAEAQRKIDRVTNNPLYQYFLGPLYRRLFK